MKHKKSELINCKKSNKLEQVLKFILKYKYETFGFRKVRIYYWMSNIKDEYEGWQKKITAWFENI